MLASSLAPPPSETLFVTGLPMDCTNEFCNEIFSQYGTVKTTTVLPVSPGKTKAAAFVIMTNVEDAQWIVDHVNGNVPQNLTAPVSVVFATPRDKMASPMGKGMMMKGSMMKGASPMAMKGAMGGKGATGAAMGGAYGGYESSGAGMGGGYGGYDSSGAGIGGGYGGSWGGSWGGSYGGYGGKDYGSSKGFGKSLPQDVKKYKTIMCRFFETTGNCQRGESQRHLHAGLHVRSSVERRCERCCCHSGRGSWHDAQGRGHGNNHERDERVCCRKRAFSVEFPSKWTRKFASTRFLGRILASSVMRRSSTVATVARAAAHEVSQGGCRSPVE
eukprot:s3990_g4.t1